jgi:hypothetical protein
VNAVLTNPDRERLAKLLGMLGSDHPGERDAAGLAAHRLVKASGLTWSSIVCIPQDEPEHHADPLGRDWAQDGGPVPAVLASHQRMGGAVSGRYPTVFVLSAKQRSNWSRSSPGFVQRGASRERARR